METSHTCLVEIRGMEIAEKSLVAFQNYTITNYVVTRLKELELHYDSGKFLEIFGSGDSSKIKDGNVFMIVNVFKDFNQNQIQNHILSVLTNLWRIKDNSVHTGQFFYIPCDPKGTDYYRGTMPIIYNSIGSINTTDFSHADFTNLLSYVRELQSWPSKLQVDYSKEMEGGELGLWQKVINYKDLHRVERAMAFITNARSVGLLPLKITNYIASLECLFSTSHRFVKKNTSERTSLFLLHHNNADKVPTHDFIQECYKIRSEYIHGSELENDLNYEEFNSVSIDLDEICRKVMNNILSKGLFLFIGSTTDIDDYFDGIGPY